MMRSTPEHKIAQARKLLIAATRQRRQEYALARAADPCGCGHRRDRHTVTCSINYTQGMCMERGCACYWFMLSPEREIDPLVDEVFG